MRAVRVDMGAARERGAAHLSERQVSLAILGPSAARRGDERAQAGSSAGAHPARKVTDDGHQRRNSHCAGARLALV